MTLAAMGTIKTESKVQYICMLVRGEALHQFDLLYVDVENKNSSLDVDYLLNGLAWYFLPVNSLLNVHCATVRKTMQFRSGALCSAPNLFE